jgi:hypothetical protein
LMSWRNGLNWTGPARQVWSGLWWAKQNVVADPVDNETEMKTMMKIGMRWGK